MIFASPLFFLLFLCFVIFLFRKKRPTVPFPHLKVLKKITPGVKVRFSFLPPLLYVVALGLIIVALARPQVTSSKVKHHTEGIDIVIALDISDSMLVPDMQPKNRLESAKSIISYFIKQRVSDQIGLVVFSGEAFTEVPMTLDYPLLQNQLKKVQTNLNVKKGTAIGMALANSVVRLKSSKNKTRIVILLTDGDNNTGTIHPNVAIEIAKENKIKVYTIGIGTSKRARIPIKTASGATQYIQVTNAFNEPLLRKIADETNGQYYKAVDRESLKNIFNKINSLEKSKVATDFYVEYEEKAFFYIQWALLLFFIGFLFSQTFLKKEVF